ncbi:MAG TPA: hypothetical protein VKA86_09555 [Candidatus Krumholzibacteria bacterium]|nr:hypothetical protein [Candidatus Krumholzibacteria bacterium]
MRFSMLVAIALVAGCGGSAPEVPVRTAEPGVVRADEIPGEIAELLTASTTDSCGVCVREKRAEVLEIARRWFPPGTRVVPVDARPLRVVDGGEMELAFDTGDVVPLSFRVHTADEHLIGIAAEDFTEPALAERVLGGSVQDVALEVVPFAYGDGPGFLFDTVTNRLQIQCRAVRRGR